MLVSGTSGFSATAVNQAGGDERKLQDDLNRFLNLLVTQLQNQDPLDPLDANEFTSQLVQFASVEQQIHQNANLEKLLAVEQNASIAYMTNYLGKIIEAEGSTLSLEGGQARATYLLADTAAQTTLAVIDAEGRVVHMTQGATDAGLHRFVWDGRDSHGEPVADGTYTLQVGARRQDGSFVEVLTTTFGRVTAAAMEGGEAILFMGNAAVPMSSVLTVEQPPDNKPADDSSD